jgi:hypothetical protein
VPTLNGLAAVFTFGDVAEPAEIVTGDPTGVAPEAGQPDAVTVTGPQRLNVIVPVGLGWLGGVAMVATSCCADPRGTVPPGVAVVVTRGEIPTLKSSVAVAVPPSVRVTVTVRV